MKFETALLHGNYAPDPTTGSTLSALWQSTSFASQTAETLEEVFSGKKPGYLYSRVANPTVASFEKRIAFLEEGQGAIACNSGMAALSAAFLNFLRPGDEILASSGIFGGTNDLFEDFRGFDIHTVYVPGSTEDFEKAITDKTAAVFVESIGNPCLDVPDIKALAAICTAHGLPLVVDSTMATPYLYRPLTLGAAIVIHSTSKFINGSSNAIGGIIVVGSKFDWNTEHYPSLLPYKKFGALSFLVKLRKTVFRNGGVCMPPMHAWLNSIGLETLSVRMERMCQNALLLARALQNDPCVAGVNYPGLESHLNHATSVEQFGGKFGAVLTIRAGSRKKAFSVINSLRFATNVSNIGDVRTLVLHPASTIFAEHTPEQRESAGVYDDLIRVSVGLENSDDIIEDFHAAFRSAQEKCV